MKTKDIILSESIKSNRIVPVTVRGDGMQPEYYNGDIVFVDTQYQNPAGGGVFCIDSGTNVARCDYAKNGIAIILSNKHYASCEVSKSRFAEIVVGRVVGHVDTMSITEQVSVAEVVSIQFTDKDREKRLKKIQGA